jgi:hypothetical protein
MSKSTGRPAGRPKGSPNKVIAARNPALARAEHDLTFIRDESRKQYDDPQSTPEAKAAAWEKYNSAVNQLVNIGLKRQELAIKREIHSSKKKSAEPVYDPTSDREPEHTTRCTPLFCVPGCPWDQWQDRQRAYFAAHPEPVAPTSAVEATVEAPAPVVVEQPKPAPVIASLKPVAPKPAPAPKPVPAPASKPAPVIRERREGGSGRYFREVFWDRPVYERNALLKMYRAESDTEWQSILEALRAPREVPLAPATEAEKRAAFDAPMVDRDRQVGQIESPDEMRQKYGSTMGNATRDSGLSVELDRRGWMPDIKQS